MNLDRKAAPPVAYPIDPPKGLFWWALALPMASALPLLAWYRAGGLSQGPMAWGVALLWLLLSAVTVVQVLHIHRGILEWDGHAWRLNCSGQPSLFLAHAPPVLWETSWLMGLRWPGSAVSRSTWLWVWRASAPSRWPALRRALFQRVHPALAQTQAGV